MIASFLTLIHPYKTPALQASFLYEYVYSPDQALKAVNPEGKKRNKKRLKKSHIFMLTKLINRLINIMGNLVLTTELKM